MRSVNEFNRSARSSVRPRTTITRTRCSMATFRRRNASRSSPFRRAPGRTASASPRGTAKEFMKAQRPDRELVNAKFGVGERELDRLTARLATERTALFEKAGATEGLSSSEQQRLELIELELDDCFLARRRER